MNESPASLDTSNAMSTSPVSAMGSVPVAATCVLPSSMSLSPSFTDRRETAVDSPSTYCDTSSSCVVNNNSVNVIKTNTVCVPAGTVVTGSGIPVAMTISNVGATATTTTIITTAVQSASTVVSSPTTKPVISQASSTPTSAMTTRMVPLIYLQPSVSVKQNSNNNTNSTNSNNNTNTNSASNNCNINSNNNTPTTIASSSTPGAVQLNMSQILAGNPQLIHSNPQGNQTIAYLGTIIKQVKDGAGQKVLLTTMQNKGSPVTGVILPAGNENHAAHNNKQPVASLILQPAGHGNNGPGKMGFMLPGSTTTNPTTGKQSLLLPAPPGNSNTKKSVANIIMPNAVKSSVPNIIRQSSSSAPNNSPKTPVAGYILPTGSNPTSLIIPSPTVAGKPAGNQVTSLIIPASTSSPGSIIIPSTASNSPGQLTNLIFTTTPTSLPQTTNAPIGLIMTSGTTATNILVPSAVPTTGSNTSTTTTTSGCTKTMTGVFLPVSMPQGKATLTHHLTISNGKIHAGDTAVSVAGLKPVAGYAAIPPLQPITNKDGAGKVSFIASNNKQNYINISTDSNSFTLVPVGNDPKDGKDTILGKIKEEKKDDVEIELRIEKIDKNNDMRQENANKIEKEKEVCSSDSDSKIHDDSVVLDGEVTMRRLNGSSDSGIGDGSNGADKENTSPDKSIDDEVKIEIIKQDREISPSLDDFDPIKVLEWDNKGVGKLPGSDLKFRMNEFGMMVVHDEEDMKEQESIMRSHKERKDEKRPHKEPVRAKNNSNSKDQQENPDADEILCCDGCGCYGLFAEFLDTKYCSIACKKSVMTKIAVNKKREDDKLRELKLRRKKRKIKILQNKARKELELQAVPKKDPPIDWMKELAELRAKKAAAQVENGDDGSKKDVSESPNMSEVDISIRSGTTSPTLTDDDHGEKRGTVPWISKSGEFAWTTYLNHYKAKAAPVKLFKDSFPYGKNGFRVGMKLEGIDPEHQSYICVISVVEVRGYRIRLHFDGYPENHDFWLNADSPDIFQPGWCEKNNHMLHRPRGYSLENFNWNLYLKQCKAQPAPRHLFSNRNANPICPNQFRVGMKLEAVDRKNSSLVCVATVADIIDNRLLIHFDSWGDVYDYWADPTSPYIHPVGWCKENGHELTPPNTYKNPSTFSWDNYLKETKSVAAPARAFKTRPPSGFRQGMKLEAVDKRSPHLIRVASIRDVHQHQIKIMFDGFPDHFGYWVDDDSPDIHPVGWTQKTGHPLEPPPVGDEKTECTTPGCKGDGHIKGAKYTSHKHPSVCPYSSQNMNKDSPNSLDRFCTKPDLYEVPESSSALCKTKVASSSKLLSDTPVLSDDSSTNNVELRTLKTRTSCYSTMNFMDDEKEKKEERRGRKRKILEPEEPSEELNKLRKDLIETVLRPGYAVSADSPPCWIKHSTTFGLKVDWFTGDPRRWTYKQVSAFINTVHPMRNKVFIEQEIDGEALLMLTQSDLTDLLGLKLGPAIKIFNIITLLRQKVT